MISKKLIIASLLLVAIYTAVIVASGLGWNPAGQTWNFNNSGTFGDSFGPLSSLMAALAAASAWMAYSSQREELARIKEDSAKERASANKRDFETTFFSMLDLLRTTVQELSASDSWGQNPTFGRSAIKQILSSHLMEANQANQTDEQLYTKVYGLFRDELGHYFRTLYHIVRFVDEAEIENKMMYIRLLRATLSNAEMVLLGLNCLHGGGRLKFKALVEKYALLHNISSSYAYKWDLVSQFNKKAFGNRKISKGKIESEWP